jgi:2-polyprenyl-3-methyl-5-hydroxy-6-metoxy-1,4-benzoquinol methylase
LLAGIRIIPLKTRPFISEISRRYKLAVLLRHLPRKASILEVGSGDNWFTGRLRGLGYCVTTLDLAGNADIVGDIHDWEKLGIDRGAFDVVVALEVVEHAGCWDALKAVCRPGGLIFISSPHPGWDWVMKMLEAAGLNQKRTSSHDHLADFHELDLPATFYRRPMWVHQVGLFRNVPLKR